VSFPVEGCTAIADGCAAMVLILEMYFPIFGRPNWWLETQMPDNFRVVAFWRVATIVCRLGRHLRLVRTPHDDLGPYRKELLQVLTCFDLILQVYRWRDDPAGARSMDDPVRWCISWPFKWPAIPCIRADLLEGLDRAGLALHQKVLADQAAAQIPPPPAPAPEQEPTTPAARELNCPLQLRDRQLFILDQPPGGIQVTTREAEALNELLEMHRRGQRLRATRREGFDPAHHVRDVREKIPENLRWALDEPDHETNKIGWGIGQPPSTPTT
jgi:hypothetical protein